MGKVAPSVIARERLQQLLAGSIDRERNIVSALVEAVTRLVVQELVEGEQADWLGGRGRYERREERQAGLAQWLRARSDPHCRGLVRRGGAAGAGDRDAVPVVVDELSRWQQ